MDLILSDCMTTEQQYNFIFGLRDVQKALKCGYNLFQMTQINTLLKMKYKVSPFLGEGFDRFGKDRMFIDGRSFANETQEKI